MLDKVVSFRRRGSNFSVTRNMQVVLVQNQAISLASPQNIACSNGVYYYVRNANVNVPQMPTGGNKLVIDLFRGLKLNDTRKGLIERIRGWQIRVNAGVQQNPNHYHASRGTYSTSLCIQDVGDNGLFGTLHKNFGDRIKLRFELRNVNQNNVNGYSSLNLDITDEPIASLPNHGTFGCEKNNIQTEYCQTSMAYWINSGYTFSGTITITAIIPEKLFTTEDTSVEDKLCINKMLLSKEIACDVTIIPQNGVAIKCHKNFLCAHSAVFETMLQGSMKESKTSTVEVVDMAEVSVRAFLAYLYYWETKEALANSLICYELYHAGHKYDIYKLEDCMKKILLSKENKWYDVDVAMRLFLFSRNIKEGLELKMKAIQVLKSQFSSLENSESYKRLFKKDPKAAMELCKYAFSV